MTNPKKQSKVLQLFIVLVLVCAFVSTPGCTINFKAKELELETIPPKPNVGISQSYRLESTQLL